MTLSETTNIANGDSPTKNIQSTIKQSNGTGSLVGSWLFSRNSQNVQPNSENKTLESTSSSILTESIEKNYKRDMSPKEKRDCEIIGLLFIKYLLKIYFFKKDLFVDILLL